MKKKKRVSIAIKLLVVLFALYAAVTFVQLNIKNNDLKNQNTSLAQQIDKQETTNDQLRLCATYLRNSPRKDEVIYFGPMGCRTGCYLVMFGDLKSEDVFELVLSMCDFVLSFEGEIPGASPSECGNFSEQNLNMAKFYIEKYKTALETYRNFEYK